MKKYLLFIIAAILFAACSSDNDNPNYNQFEDDPKNIKITNFDSTYFSFTHPNHEIHYDYTHIGDDFLFVVKLVTSFSEFDTNIYKPYPSEYYYYCNAIFEVFDKKTNKKVYFAPTSGELHISDDTTITEQFVYDSDILYDIPKEYKNSNNYTYKITYAYYWDYKNSNSSKYTYIRKGTMEKTKILLFKF